MQVDIVQNVLFKRCGILRTIESVVFLNSINSINKLHLYKCKKYKTQQFSKPIIEIGLYFKIIDDKDYKDYEFKIDLDLFISDKEKHFKKYDITDLKEKLLSYPIDDIDYVCNKIIESINHNYF